MNGSVIYWSVLVGIATGLLACGGDDVLDPSNDEPGVRTGSAVLAGVVVSASEAGIPSATLGRNH